MTMFHKKSLVHLCVLLLTFYFSETFAANFWYVKGIDISSDKQQKISRDSNQCINYLRNYFPKEPELLTIYAYNSTHSFRKGLESEYGFSSELADKYGTFIPKARNGKLLVPPNASRANICHEIVHVFMELFTNKSELVKTKWLDEGFAEFFGRTAFIGRDFFVQIMKKRVGDELFSPSIIRQASEWSKLRSKGRVANKLYYQAALMGMFLFERIENEGFLYLLDNLNHLSFETILLQKFNITSGDFYSSFSNYFSTLD